MAGNIILGVKLSQLKEPQESTFVVTYNEYDRTSHNRGALSDEIESTIKDKSFKYVNEFSLSVINIFIKDGENIYKEEADQVTYYNTNIENIKSIVTEIQQVYSWMSISY